VSDDDDATPKCVCMHACAFSWVYFCMLACVTDQEVRMEHGKIHLRAVKIPVLYQVLGDVEKAEIMKLMSSPSFDWSASAVLAAPKVLRLTIGKNLANMFKFVKAMQEAVELGVAEDGDLVPDWSLQRLHNEKLVQIREKR
jgi:hypothetical protein